MANMPDKWSWHNYPNPQSGDGKCGLPKDKKSWVCDPNHLLGGEDKIRQLDGLITSVFNSTAKRRCPCSQYLCDEQRIGYSFGVALVKYIQEVQDGNLIDGQEIRDNLQLAHVFAMHTYKKWNLGKCENDVLIVYSPMNNSGVVYTLTGSTTEKRLTNNDVVQITSFVLPQFVPNPDSLFKGLHKMMLDYRDVLNGDLVFGTMKPITAQPVVQPGSASDFLPHILGTIATTVFTLLLTYVGL